MNTPINSVGHITFVNLKQGSKGNSSINTGALACIVGVKRGREGGGGGGKAWMDGGGLLTCVLCLPNPSLFTHTMQVTGDWLGAAVASRSRSYCDTVPYLAMPGRRLRNIY